MDWTKINKVLSKVEIKRESVAGKITPIMF